MKASRATAALLAVLGCVAIAIVGSWTLALAWAAAAIVIGSVWGFLEPRVRVSVAVVLLALCVVLVWEGGLYFVPSVIALLLDSFSARQRAAV